MNWLEKIIAGFATSRGGAWITVNVLFRIDRVLLRLSRGSLGLAIGWNMLLLTTTGAKSGKPRTIPLLYIPDGKNLVLIASNGGRPHHPGWYWNLRAHPEATVLKDGRAAPYLAQQVTGESRARLWRKAVNYYPGYAAYSARARGRPIPVIVLTPK